MQRDLLEFAEEELEMPCEVEHVACGTGLKRIHRFLCHKHGELDGNLVRSSCSCPAPTLCMLVFASNAAGRFGRSLFYLHCE